MKSVLISCVTHNSYKELGDYLETINSAAQKASDICTVSVVVADNSTTKKKVDISKYTNINIEIKEVENLGYFGSSQKSIEYLYPDKIKLFDFVIISNVDIKLDSSFIVKLCEVETKNVGWIVNREFTHAKNKEENPMYISRISKSKLQILKILYSFPLLYAFYEKCIYPIRQKKKQNYLFSNQNIYAGHGSVIILTKNFIDKNFPLNFPCFLYGEEIFIAELVIKSNLKTIFIPSIYVENISSVSTGKILNNSKCKMLKKSCNMLLEYFFTENKYTDN